MAIDPAIQPMFGWLDNVPAADLATELMGSFGRDARDWKRVRDLMCELFAANGYPNPPLMLNYTAYWPIEEAAQLLEHSELLYKMASENEFGAPTGRVWRR